MIKPTRSGKSLCFQLFPFISGKMTVVLTLTISLMKDQCCKLGERGIPATHTGSSQNDASIDDKIRNKNFKLIFATPENFFSNEGNPSKVSKIL